MRARLEASLFLIAILAFCVPMSAHHGNAAYGKKEVVLKGAVVKAFLWANPHCIIRFDVKDDQGTVTHWAVEAGSPSALVNKGWTKASLQPGDVITVYLHQAKTGNPVGRITHVVLANGTTLSDSSGGGSVPNGPRTGGRSRSQY